MVPLIKDKMVVAYHPDHQFHSKEIVEMNDLMYESFIMPTGMYQSHVEELFAEAQIKPSILLKYTTVQPSLIWYRKDLALR